MKIITQNKKAFYDYEILEKIEAGIVLTGDEVKSIRAGHVNLIGSFATIHESQLTLINCNITPYSHAYNKTDEKASRTRVLLVHRKQINRLAGDISRKGITIVPLKMYFNEKGFVKIELGICKHKKAHQRKEEMREKDIQRETRRELKGSYKY